MPRVPLWKSYDKGVEYAIQGEFKEAKEEFEKALRVDSFYVPAKGSVKVIEDVIYHNIESKTAIHFFNAVAYSNKGRYDQAIAEFTKAIEINPHYAKAYNTRGFVYLVGSGNKVKGCADWKKACELGICRNYNHAKQKGDCF